MSLVDSRSKPLSVASEPAPTTRYTTVAITLHWVIAAAILGQIASGIWMVDFAGESAARFTVYQLHKTAGLIVLALTFARIIWRLAHPAPELPVGMTKIETFGAKFTHVLFYALMILVPLSGWIMVSVSPTAVPTFLFMVEQWPFAHLPVPFASTAEAMKAAENAMIVAHKALAFATFALFVLHVAAACKHQFIAKDGLLMRMVPVGRALVDVKESAGIAALTVVVGFLGLGLWAGIVQKSGGATQTQLEAVASDWVIDNEASTLGFQLSYTGRDISATISNWQAAISFDPDALDQSSASVTIDMASVSIDEPTLQSQSAGADGFDLSNHPTATFEADEFVAEGEDFVANGRLTIKGIEVPVRLPFSFSEAESTAKVIGSATIDRRELQIGLLGAADESWLKFPVSVTLDLTATRAAQ